MNLPWIFCILTTCSSACQNTRTVPALDVSAIWPTIFHLTLLTKLQSTFVSQLAHIGGAATLFQGPPSKCCYMAPQFKVMLRMRMQKLGKDTGTAQRPLTPDNLKARQTLTTNNSFCLVEEISYFAHCQLSQKELRAFPPKKYKIKCRSLAEHI